MTTRSTILSLAALATLSLSALAPTQASAWGMRDGYGYRSMGYVGSSEPCPNEYAPVIRHYHARRFIHELPCEEEAFQTRGYETRGYETRGFETRGFESRGNGPERMPRGYAPMRQAQGYGQGSRQMQPAQGYAPPQQGHHLEPHGQSVRRDSEDNQEIEAPQQPANRDAGPAEFAQTELQR
jgi:hypothetical protein